MERELTNKRSVTIAELIGIAVIILSSVLMFWKTTDVRMSNLELRMNLSENSDQKILKKLDDLQESVNDLKITVKDKQDRKP